MSRSLLVLAVIATALPAAAEWRTDPDSPTTYPSLRIGGFTDFNFVATDDDTAESSTEFKEGQFVLHFTSDLAKRIFFFAEITLTARDDQFKTEVERTLIKFSVADAFKPSFGRFHTPINWWNDTFHHGLWLQTTAERPIMTTGAGLIPIHFVGAMAEGTFSGGPMTFDYDLGVGNGRNEILSRAGDAGDVNDSKAAVASFSLRPDALYNLKFGAAFYADKLSFDYEESLIEVDETIASAYLVWTKETPEIIAEYSTVTHDVQGGQEYDASGYYLQLAYRLPVWGSKLKPYARYEDMDVEEGDPVLAGTSDKQGGLAGLRVDVSSFVAVKLEYQHFKSGNADYIDEGHLQISFAF